MVQRLRPIIKTLNTKTLVGNTISTKQTNGLLTQTTQVKLSNE